MHVKEQKFKVPPPLIIHYLKIDYEGMLVSRANDVVWVSGEKREE